MSERHNPSTEDASAPCACGSTLSFERCCSPFLTGSQLATSAEQLMRSRYTAFVREDEAYLKSTWHPDTRPSRVRLGRQRWLGLSIRATCDGGAQDLTGTVEFVARFKVLGAGHRLHEVSRFEKIDGRWYYLDGEHL